MSDHHGKPPTSVGEFVAALLGGLLMPGLVIFLIVKLVLGIQSTHGGDDPAAASAAVVKRIEPIGTASLKDTSTPQVAKSGEQVVNEICIACHGTGALGSPKIGDAGAWGPRIGQGYDTLVKHATDGIRAMPARGGNADLSDIEVAAAVVYMANKGGANFKAPAIPKVEAAPAADAKAEPAAAPAGK
jgi:cytochrome c5